MSVSRRLRYEILRRDDHTCRYCGAVAPNVKLTVDHVLPIALGGSDEASNLVTACADCNAGKSSSSPDAPIVDGVADDALRWAAAVKKAAAAQAARTAERGAYLDAFDNAWYEWEKRLGEIPRDLSWEVTIGRQFDMGMEISVLVELVNNVVPRHSIYYEHKWRYFCGALRNVNRELQEAAASIVAHDGATA